MPGSIYFITFRTYKGYLLDDNSKQIIYDNILFYKSTMYKLYTFVIMPDQIHLILQTNEIDSNNYINLSKIMQSIKGYSSKIIIKYKTQTGASKLLTKNVFQSESFDRIIRDDVELLEKMNYIRNNPVKNGLVENGNDYQWYYLNSE
jgi:REP element-mobilizing transposase RayT